MDRKTLVVGGTRGTGLLIAQRLLQRSYRVRVLARDPARAATRLDPAVEVIPGDITDPYALPPAVSGVHHIIFTAGVRSGRIASESVVRSTDYQGVLNTLEAARSAGFGGRFVYLNSIGINTRSWAASLLNLTKGNTLIWRRRVERKIRRSGVDYTTIRVGFLVNRPGGRRAVAVSQNQLALAPRNRIAREDVAAAFVEALEHPRTSRATFEIVWGEGAPGESWTALLDRIRPDAESVTAGESR